VTGIAFDSLHRRAILSVWNGFLVVDLRTRSIVATIGTPPAENFGFDPQTERIIVPFYPLLGCLRVGNAPPCELPRTLGGQPMTDGVLIVDLANGNAIHTFQDPTASDPAAPAGEEPDSAAADSNNGIIVVPEESGPVHVIDLSQAVFEGADVTAPQQVLTPTRRLTGVAVEPASHIAFLEGEFADNVGFLAIDGLAALAGAITEATMPPLPGNAGGFSNLGDPHGIAVTTGIIDNRPVGFVVDSGLRWVARIDLAQALALPATANVIADTDLATVTTYLDARTPAP
jgi:hypothetical protein